MVGVPQSKGCRLCVRRRVRCDQNGPQCGNCVRYGVECPGYDRALKFVADRHRVRQRGGGGPQQTAPQCGITRRPSMPRGGYIYSLLTRMHAAVTPGEIAFMGSWFGGVESRLGSQATLDSAVTCLTLHMLGKAKKDAVMVGESHHLYGRSLQSLQRVLMHKSEWRSTETLCATTILCYFELFAGTTDAGSWMKHASGVGTLIQSRGPQAYLEEWDREIFKTFRALMVMEALFSLKDCFLARPEWQALLGKLRLHDRPTDTVCFKRRDCADQYLIIIAKVPTIFRHIFPIHVARMQGLDVPVDPESLRPVMRYADQTLEELIRWSETLCETFTPPTEVPSKDPTSPFPLVYAYDNVWDGALYMGYWATRIILQYSLSVGGGRDEFPTSIGELCMNIYRSIETVGAGLMGPYRIGYSVRIAFDLAEPRIQQWIRGLLGSYGTIYASLDMDSFSFNNARGGAALRDTDDGTRT